MEEKNKRNKGLIVIIIILILLVLGFGGYFVYDMFLKTEEPVKVEEVKEEVVEADFYSVGELVRNKYIEKITDVSSENIEIKNNKVYVVADMYNSFDSKLVEADGVVGTPKYVYCSSYQAPSNSIFAVLTEEGDLYYSDLRVYSDADLDKEILPVPKFEKINSEPIMNIYTTFTIEQDFFPQYPGEPLSLYLETEKGELIVLSDGKLEKTFEEKWPYVDQICGYIGGDYCKGLVISPERSLYNEYYDDKTDASVYEEVKYENEVIKVRDGFSISTSKDNDVADLTDSKYYIIGEDNYVYEIDESIETGEIISVKRYSETKIKNYKYNILGLDEKEVSSVDVVLTYENNKTKTIDNVASISTLYYRYNK